MNTNWKARLKALLQKGDAYTLIPFVSIVLGTVMSAFATILFGGNPPWTPWKMILTCYGISVAGVYTFVLLEAFFQKNHYLDEHIISEKRKEEKERKKKEKEVEEQRQKEKLKYIHRLTNITNNWKYIKEEYKMMQDASRIALTILELSKGYKLAVEDEYTLLQTIPSDIADILDIYFSMPHELRYEKREEVEQFMKNKRDEIENNWKANIHGNLTFELQKKIEVAKIRGR